MYGEDYIEPIKQLAVRGDKTNLPIMIPLFFAIHSRPCPLMRLTPIVESLSLEEPVWDPSSANVSVNVSMIDAGTNAPVGVAYVTDQLIGSAENFTDSDRDFESNSTFKWYKRTQYQPQNRSLVGYCSN